MTPIQDLVAQIDTLWAQLKAQVPQTSTTPATPTITTADGLTAALLVGGRISVGPGTYTGNFIISKPTTLALDGATLAPKDLFSPTLAVKASDVTVTGGTIQLGASDREAVVVGDFYATSAAQQPSRVTFDGVTVTAGAQGGKRGLALHGSAITVRNSRVTGFWRAGQDAQAIWIHNGPGPYTIENNYLEASGEVIMAGGDSVKIPNGVPTDIVIRGNTCFKPESWRTNGSTVKNSIEIKNGRHVLIENNILDGNWRSGQDGNPIVLTVRNQTGDTPWAIVDDITVRGNTTKRCAEGAAVGILGFDNNFPSQQTKSILIEHNLFSDSPVGVKVGNGVTDALVIRNNTLPAITAAVLQFYDSRGPAAVVKSSLTFVANVAKGGDYGVSGDGTGVGLPSLQTYTNVVDFSGNILEKTAARGIPWPAGNMLVEPGGLAALLDPKTFKLLNGTAGY